VITTEDKAIKEAWWKGTWMCMDTMNTTETCSYWTYCFHYGPARHVQTRSVSGSAFGCVWTRWTRLITRSYCTYCFRRGSARHVQTRSLSESAPGCVWTRLITCSYCTYGFRRRSARHVQTRSVSDGYSVWESRTETDRAASCRKGLKHDNVNVYINTAL
jgi:hypothetical protein